MKKVLIASPSRNSKMSDVINKMEDHKVVAFIEDRGQLMAKVEEYRPEILFITNGMEGDPSINIVSLILSIHRKYPLLRIIYWAGYVANDDIDHLKILASLANEGIYDIYHEAKMNTKMLENLFEYRKSERDVSYLLQYTSEADSIQFRAEDSKISDPGCRNVIIFSSIKPGSGKSFIATNVAAAIAKYGKSKKDGSRPKVAIIEGDLQTLSVGTLLEINDEEKNLRAALRKMETIIDDEGRIFGSNEEILETKRFLRSCCLKYGGAEAVKDETGGLYALVGSQLSLQDLTHINPYQYSYMIQLLVDQFDVIIVDTNSSLEHRTTKALLELANRCYYLIDLDYNNIRNNLRYKKDLSELGIDQKIGYILNRDIPDYMNFAEKLDYSADDLDRAGFELTAKVPMIDTAIIFNQTKRGVPIIYRKIQETLHARKEIFKIAETIWPLTNQAEIDEEEQSYISRSGKGTAHIGWFSGFLKLFENSKK